MPMRLMLLYSVFVLLLLLLFSIMYSQIEDSSRNNSVRRKKKEEKIMENKLLTWDHEKRSKNTMFISDFEFWIRSISYAFFVYILLFSFSFCFVFLIFFSFRFFIKCSIVFPKCLFKVAQILFLKMDISACS